MEQTKVTTKRPREESSSTTTGEGPAQRMVPKAPGACAEPRVPATSANRLHESSPCTESAQSPFKELPVPNSASVLALPVAAAVAIVQYSIEQTNEESDDVEELLMRALEEELETPSNEDGSAVTSAAVFRDVEEDDNYDESEDDEE